MVIVREFFDLLFFLLCAAIDVGDFMRYAPASVRESVSGHKYLGLIERMPGWLGLTLGLVGLLVVGTVPFLLSFSVSLLGFGFKMLGGALGMGQKPDVSSEKATDGPPVLGARKSSDREDTHEETARLLDQFLVDFDDQAVRSEDLSSVSSGGPAVNDFPSHGINVVSEFAMTNEA